MTSLLRNVRDHYQANIENRDDLLSKIATMLDSMHGEHLDTATLASLDQFHFGGLAATAEFAKRIGIRRGAHVLDAGSGLGGPSRFLAEVYQCTVKGVDLAPDYVAIANLLAERSGLSSKVHYEVDDLTSLAFSDAAFDLVFTQHVVMNISNREGLYREMKRVLKSDGVFAFYDVLAGNKGDAPYYPVPWSETPETSTLLNETETRNVLDRVGFKITRWDDVTDEAFGWLAVQQEAPRLIVHPGLIVGERMGGMVANFIKNLKEGKTRLVIGVCTLQ